METTNIDSGVELSPAAIEAYQRDGTVYVPGLLNADWVERVREAIDQVLADVASGNGTRKMVHVWRFNETFRELATESAAPRLAGEVSGANELQLLFDHLLVKEPGTSASATLWHHDLPYWPVRGQHICTVWIALDRVTIENGAVEYAKGTHRSEQLYRPAMPPELIWGQAEGLPVPPDVPAHRDQFDVVHYETEPGDCLLHHPLTLHGAPPNSSTSVRRRAIAIRYVGEDTRFVGGGAGAPIMNEDQPIGAKLDEAEHPVVWRRSAHLVSGNA
jgi:ectoine hydroxylase-related dioxygenase (phytanoyl-CoA dioxygenase family)